MSLFGWIAAVVSTLIVAAIMALIWTDVGLILSGQPSISARLKLFSAGRPWVILAVELLLQSGVLLLLLHFFLQWPTGE